MSTLTKYLIVFGMSMVPVIELRGGIPFGVTAGLHWWRRSTLLSIAAGTVCYMLLVQLVFV